MSWFGGGVGVNVRCTYYVNGYNVNFGAGALGLDLIVAIVVAVVVGIVVVLDRICAGRG